MYPKRAATSGLGKPNGAARPFQHRFRAPPNRKECRQEAFEGPSGPPKNASEKVADLVATKMARSTHPGRALEALKRYKFQGFGNFSKPHVLPGLGLLGTILGPDLVPVYMYMRKQQLMLFRGPSTNRRGDRRLK